VAQPILAVFSPAKPVADHLPPIQSTKAKAQGPQSDSRARVPSANTQRFPQVQLFHGFTSLLADTPGWGAESHWPRTFAFSATEISAGRTSPNFPMSG
jgi:hypothetical protein